MLVQFDIPDELLPAMVAEFHIVSTAGGTTATTPQEYFALGAVEILRQRAELYRVGPYYIGPVDPQFNADGTPYVAGGEEPGGVMVGSTTLVRARDADGIFIADDPSTPDIDEAWVLDNDTSSEEEV